MITKSFWLLVGLKFLIQQTFSDPVRISPAIVHENRKNVCPLNSTIEARVNDTRQEIKRELKAIFPACSGTGWTKIASLNMNNPHESCPSGLKPLHSPVKACSRPASFIGCVSVMFPVHVPYSNVCGRILAYQYCSTNAFDNSNRGGHSLESSYVDGVSLTHGRVGSRQHIWTFASALNKRGPSSLAVYQCACTNTQHSWPYQVPPYVGNNYFCDTGNPGSHWELVYYPDDPLWDGEGCGPHSTCCQLNNPPWFQTSLPHSTRDDIEMRVCGSHATNDEDVAIFMIDIFVK